MTAESSDVELEMQDVAVLDDIFLAFLAQLAGVPRPGFIRAETIAYDDYVALNGEAGARDAGKLRQEGKEYVVKDGDVLHFKFNV